LQEQPALSDKQMKMILYRKDITTIKQVLTRLIVCVVFAMLAAVALYSQPANSQALPLTKTDINTAAAGSLSYNTGTYTVQGDGTGIGGTSDSFTYTWSKTTGNIELTANVASQTNTSNYAVAGLMIRSSLNPDATCALISVSPLNGVNFTARSSDGSGTNTTLGPSIASPTYLRIVRSGTSIAGYQSADGSNWSLIGIIQITLPDTYYVGLAVSSNSSPNLSSATFDHLVLANNVPQRSADMICWLRADSGVTITSGKVSAWMDQSDNGNNATQSVAGSRPTLVSNAINGVLPAIDFVGSSVQVLKLPSGFKDFTQGATFFIVTKPKTPVGFARFIEFGNGLSSDNLGLDCPSTTSVRMTSLVGSTATTVTASNALTNNAYQLIEATHSGTTGTIYQNGVQKGSGALSAITNINRTVNNIGLGSGGTFPYTGEIAELLVFKRALTADERVSIENYVYSKYGIGSPPAIAAPTITPKTGIFTGPQTVSITTNAGSLSVITFTTNGTDPTPSSPQYSGPFTVSSPTTVKAMATVGNTSSAITTSLIQIDATTTNISRDGLTLWLRSDTGVSTSGSSVTNWTDVSGTGNSASQSTPSKQPTLISNAINSLPAVNFASASSQALQLPSGQADFTAGASIFIVTKPTSVTAGARFIDFGNAAGSNNVQFYQPSNTAADLRIYNGATPNSVSSSNAVTLNQFQLLEAIHDGAGFAAIYTAGVQGAGGAINNITNVTRTGNFIGQSFSGSPFLNGQIAEVLIYKRKLSLQERIAIEKYASSRYFNTLASPSILPGTGVYSGQTLTMSAIPGSQIFYSVDGSTPNTSSTLYQGPISVQQSTLFKAIAYVSPNTSAVSSAYIAIDPRAQSVSRNNLMVWLKSDDAVITNGLQPNKVLNWLDLSGNNFDATPFSSTASVGPFYVANANNGYPAVSFNGGSEYFVLPAMFTNFTGGTTLFAVASTGTGNILDIGNSSGTTSSNDVILDLVSSSATANFKVFNGATSSQVSGSGPGAGLGVIEGIHNGQASGTTGFIVVNGTQTASGTLNKPNTLNRTQNWIGHSFTPTTLTGSLSELLLYGSMTTSERAAVESYLIQKYQTKTRGGAPAAPVFSVTAGTQGQPLQVAIAAPADVTVYVTTDGSTPTTSSPVYSGPIYVYFTQTIKALVVAKNGLSTLGSATYTLDSNVWPAPSASDATPLKIRLELPTNTY
jgi:hypothetical protein